VLLDITVTDMITDQEREELFKRLRRCNGQFIDSSGWGALGFIVATARESLRGADFPVAGIQRHYLTKVNLPEFLEA
jgi:hypothetical protein